MAHSPQQPRTRNTSTTHHTKPSTLSSILHTTLTTILPLLFFTTFVIASTIVLNYSLSLNQPVPTRFIVGVSAAFAALIGLSIFLLVWSRLQAIRRTRKAKDTAGGNVENISTAHQPRFAMTPAATTVESESEPEPEQTHTQTHTRALQQQQQHHAHRLSFPPPLPPSSRHHPGPIIARPIPTYRGLPRPLTVYHHQNHHAPPSPPPPPRRGSIELSAITERSLESERRPSDHRPSSPVPPSTPHPLYHPPNPIAQNCRRQQPPVPYRSPSVASLPESLRAPGRGAEMLMSRPELGVEIGGQVQGQGRRGMRPGAGWILASPGSSPIPEWRSGPVQLPMPSVPEPLRFGASILGRGGEGEGERIGGLGGEGEGEGGGGDERRRLMKATGLGTGVM